jgi:MOSC domain-containing protein YiiM
MVGSLIAIARAARRGAFMELLDRTVITEAGGVEGDARGALKGSQVTVLFREGWEAACRDVGADLPWTTRRANLYVDGLEVPRQVGARLRIGEVELEVAQETRPCALMEAAFRGLRDAMRPEWRGGVACDVVRGGAIRVGDDVSAELEPAR